MIGPSFKGLSGRPAGLGTASASLMGQVNITGERPALKKTGPMFAKVSNLKPVLFYTKMYNRNK